MTTNTEDSGLVGFYVEENLQGGQGCASDACSRGAGQNTADSREYAGLKTINACNGHGNEPITAVTELEAVAPEVEVECNFEKLVVEDTEYSSTNEMDCHAIGAAEKNNRPGLSGAMWTLVRTEWFVCC